MCGRPLPGQSTPLYGVYGTADCTRQWPRFDPEAAHQGSSRTQWDSAGSGGGAVDPFWISFRLNAGRTYRPDPAKKGIPIPARSRAHARLGEAVSPTEKEVYREKLLWLSVAGIFGVNRRGASVLTQMRRLLPKVASEMALHVLAYNMKRVIQILSVDGLMTAMLA